MDDELDSGYLLTTLSLSEGEWSPLLPSLDSYRDEAGLPPVPLDIHFDP